MDWPTHASVKQTDQWEALIHMTSFFPSVHPLFLVCRPLSWCWSYHGWMIADLLLDTMAPFQQEEGKRKQKRRIREYVHCVYPFKSLRKGFSINKFRLPYLVGREARKLCIWAFQLWWKRQARQKWIVSDFRISAHIIFPLGHSKCSESIHLLWNDAAPLCDTHLPLPF